MLSDYFFIYVFWGYFISIVFSKGEIMKNVVLATLVVATMGSSIMSVAKADQEGAGVIIGGVLGGLIGNKVGKGGGREGATIIGAIAGAVIGAKIGRDMDRADRRALEEAQLNSLQGSLNQRVSWDGLNYGSRTGYRGEFVTLREGRHIRSGLVCREYESVIIQGARTEVTRGSACRRPNGSWSEVTTTEVTYDNGMGAGYCSDYDHSQFFAAKQFAYSGSGLNMSDSEATRWALSYNQTHNCGTISDYSQRFNILFDLAYSGGGLNMSASKARQFALSKVETTSVSAAMNMRTDFIAVYDFAYSGSFLNNSSALARSMALSWVERGYCENSFQVRQLAAEFKRQYDFAYSGAGLNMLPLQAKQYAIRQIRPMTVCGDLLF
jgi:surface antigen